MKDVLKMQEEYNKNKGKKDFPAAKIIGNEGS
jgi:hypothetical protein